jgi:hypothetical protein
MRWRLRTEFQAILKEIDREILFRNAMRNNTQQIYALAEAGSRPDIATLDPMLANLLWWSAAYLTTGAVDSILVGGKLQMIESEEIRYFLAAVFMSQENVVYAYEGLRPELERVIGLLDEELDE